MRLHTGYEIHEGVRNLWNPGFWNQGIQYPFFNEFCRLILYFLYSFLFNHVHTYLNEFSYHRIHVLSNVSYFREPCRFDLQKRRLRKLGQSSCYFSLSNTRWPYHKDILWKNFSFPLIRQLLSSDPIPYSYSHGFLCFLLTHNVFIQFSNYLFRCQFIEIFHEITSKVHDIITYTSSITRFLLVYIQISLAISIAFSTISLAPRSVFLRRALAAAKA